MEKRILNSEKIRNSINDYCSEKYGIENFFSIVDEFLPESDKTQVCLARQVPTANIEHIALKLAADYLNLEALFLSFSRDSYPQSLNEYKKSLVKPIYLFKSRQGRITPQGSKLASGNVQGLILSEIKTSKGSRIVDFHQELIESVFYKPGTSPRQEEMSVFFSKILTSCSKNLPEKVFVKNGEREILTDIRDVDDLSLVRPPASWYYLFYLFIFVDGKRVLADSYSCDDGKIKSCFIDNIELIKKISGFEPLIFEVPNFIEVDGYRSNLTEIPKKSLEGNGFLNKINKPEQDKSFKLTMEHFAQELIFNS